MKVTSEKFKPRRDGYFEHVAMWGEVTVGTIIAQRDSRTDGAWEVIATAHGDLPVVDGQTLWMRIRNTTTGAELTLAPRPKTGTCVVLTRDPADTETAPPTPPTDAQAIMDSIEILGGTLMASLDNETGEVVCPDYTEVSHINDGLPGPYSRGLIEHMRFAHKMEVDDGLDIIAAMSLHAQAHAPTSPIGKAGFSHRHMPEVDILNDFIRNRRIKPLPLYGNRTQEAI